MKNVLRSIVRKCGYDLIRHDPLKSGADGLAGLKELGKKELEIVTTARKYTMTSPDRIAALMNSVQQLSANNVSGDIAECGVWRGGSMMVVAMTLMAQGDLSRNLYLYDTFEGMPPPTNRDVTLNDQSASSTFAAKSAEGVQWCGASLDEVKQNLYSTGYPREKIIFVKGKVEDTIPKTLPGSLALLRLDTDWYESTKHELKWLYPLLQPGGVLIIDDYGHWKGAKAAVDEYFQGLGEKIFLHRIDYTARMLVRPFKI